MIYFVQTLVLINGRRTHLLEVENDTTLTEMRTMLEKQFGVSENSIRFIFRGIEVDYSKTYGELELGRHNGIHAIIRTCDLAMVLIGR